MTLLSSTAHTIPTLLTQSRWTLAVQKRLVWRPNTDPRGHGRPEHPLSMCPKKLLVLSEEMRLLPIVQDREIETPRATLRQAMLQRRLQLYRIQGLVVVIVVFAAPNFVFVRLINVDGMRLLDNDVRIIPFVTMSPVLRARRRYASATRFCQRCRPWW